MSDNSESVADEEEVAHRKAVETFVAAAYGETGPEGGAYDLGLGGDRPFEYLDQFGINAEDLVATDVSVFTTWGEIVEVVRDGYSDTEWAKIVEATPEAKSQRAALIESYLRNEVCAENNWQTDWYEMMDSKGRKAYLSVSRGDGGYVIDDADGPYQELPKAGLDISEAALNGDLSGECSLIDLFELT